ncbi:DUF1292 domain-containing protein [Thermanaeromonas sp. C210]|uniref:DUF1292 domain-containing protein n=1 Tax=Thermanaeromonas sp. C210 TaxID=2731925 RepID=UPI00155D4E14|nr:DUF1292 domain-containing protein [Thermanaeromonas sp. C210]GFN23233.1 DUF1292 domain-containing protein [Thermanaeromonas sp. C210]
MACQENTILLRDEEGQEHEFLVVDILEVDDEEYAVLLPVVDSADEAIVLKIGRDEEGREVLYAIEDEEEWERVVEAWDELVDEEEN